MQCNSLEKNREGRWWWWWETKEKMATEKNSLVKCPTMDIGMEGRIFSHKYRG
jgi:hypothetical protein